MSDEQSCETQACVKHRLVIIGGIGVTAFLPAIGLWTQQGLPFTIHYAVRNTEEAAFAELLPREATIIYSKSRHERLDVAHLVPPASSGTKVYCCGPSRLVQECKQRTHELGYPPHMAHFEDFSAPASNNLGDPFQVEVHEPDTQRREMLEVPSDKTLLQVLHEAGFDDVMSGCLKGGCGVCKVTLCGGVVDSKNTLLTDTEKKAALQSCVDRGVGKIEIEID